jgi:hypothetical protein
MEAGYSRALLTSSFRKQIGNSSSFTKTRSFRNLFLDHFPRFLHSSILYQYQMDLLRNVFLAQDLICPGWLERAVQNEMAAADGGKVARSHIYTAIYWKLKV